MRHALGTITKGALVCVFVGILISTSAGVANHGADKVGIYIGGTIAVIGIVVLAIELAAVILWGGVQAGRIAGDGIVAATHPVPSPPEIELALWREWHRQPTVEEVAAVHQMLHTERNQKLVAGGITLGALFLMQHTLHNT